MDIEMLIDFCAAHGEASGQSTLEHISRTRRTPLSVCVAEPVMDTCRRTTWTAEELQFLRENLGRMNENEIAVALGRSVNAVHIQQIRQRIPAASKRPGYLTGYKVAKLFRVDIHAVMAWYRQGIMPLEVLPGERNIMSISIQQVYRWAVRWQNWIYFKVARVRDPHLRRLVELAQERWGDEWWTIGQAAAYHQVTSSAINQRIRRGELPAVQWGNWYVRRSDALALQIRPGKGSSAYLYGNWTDGADAWILRARDELGMMYIEIAPRMKGVWDAKRVSYRYHQLKGMCDE